MRTDKRKGPVVAHRALDKTLTRFCLLVRVYYDYITEI